MREFTNLVQLVHGIEVKYFTGPLSVNKYLIFYVNKNRTHKICEAKFGYLFAKYGVAMKRRKYISSISIKLFEIW